MVDWQVELVDRLRAPLRVGVGGRPGSGRSTVIRALRGAGLTAAAAGESADVDEAAGVDVCLYVFVETLNADDRAALASAARPVVAVLNKADLAGFGGNGPMAAAAERCRQLQRATAVPTVALSALLAVAGTDPVVLDAGTVDALHLLSTAPARVPDDARRRLAVDLDLFGTACAVSAVRSGAGRDDVTALLRMVSGIGEVCAAIDRAAAPVRYRRLTEVLTELGTDDARVARMLTGDDVVLARMAAAAAVVRAAGAADVACSTRSDHLRRAIHWQRYARGPVSALHRACAVDIARGALRLWSRADGAVAAPR
ncbi:MAG: hypothetical protein WCP30_11430 [Mycobacteriaceae bacterium]